MVAMRTCISVFIQMIEKESLGDFIVLEKRNKSDLFVRYVVAKDRFAN